MSWTRRFLPTNFLSYPCFYTYINAKTEHIITVVSFEWSDITEFSNKSSETSVMSSKIKKKFCYIWICRVLLLLLQSISRKGLDSFFGGFIRRYSGDVQKRAIKHAPDVYSIVQQVIQIDIKMSSGGKVFVFSKKLEFWELLKIIYLSYNKFWFDRICNFGMKFKLCIDIGTIAYLFIYLMFTLYTIINIKQYVVFICV